ncbi:MAG TPA: methionyl-tRNA formyltransferase [Deltaproteobacteria bacterium]|nr:methionyl-tRNA formyltransferase [Deltaproteobacteria bacterium]
MRLAFMGTPDFALPTIQALIETKRHDLVCAITQPDKPKGRGRHVKAPAVKQYAMNKGIPVLQPVRIRDNQEIYTSLVQYRLDAVIVVAYGKILPAEMLDIPVKGFINVHASLLPSLRGAAPINRAILQGCASTGISIMQIDAGMDTGPVYRKVQIPIETDDDAVTLSSKLGVLGAETLLEVLDLVERDNLQPIPQDHEKATYAPMLRKDEGEIDWNQDPITIHNMIRGLVPWPCAHSHIGPKTLKIWKASYLAEDHDLPQGSLVKDASGLKIACAGGYIIPHALQIEGRNIVDSHAFSCGLKNDRIILSQGGLQ